MFSLNENLYPLVFSAEGFYGLCRRDRDLVVFDAGQDGQDGDGVRLYLRPTGSKQARDAALAAQLRLCMDWDADAVSQVPGFKLVKQDGGLRLVGALPGTLVRSVPWDGKRCTPVPESLGAQGWTQDAILEHGPYGALVCDPGRGLIWSLSDGICWHLSGVNTDNRGTLRAMRVPGGVVVHSCWNGRMDVLGRVSDGGGVRNRRTGEMSEANFVWVQGQLYTVLSGEGREHAICAIDLGSGVATPVLPLTTTVFMLSAQGEEVVAGCPNGDVWRFQCRGGVWSELGLVEIPRNPKSQALPSLGQNTATWTGPPGPFELKTVLRNGGGALVGLQLSAQSSSGVVLESATIGGVSMDLEQGRARFASLSWSPMATHTLTLRGQASGPGAVTLALSWLRATTRFEQFTATETQTEAVPVGTLQLRVSVQATLCAVRDGEHLDWDPAWSARLAQAGVLDTRRPKPELERWTRRALRRCRVDRVEQAPEAVHQAWLGFSAKERGAHDGRVPAYKLQSPEHWILSAEEAAQIASAFPQEHPLRCFCAGGAFVMAPRA